MRHIIVATALVLAAPASAAVVELDIGLPEPAPGFVTRYLLTLDGVGKTTEVRSAIEAQFGFEELWWYEPYPDDWRIEGENYTTYADCGAWYGPCPSGGQTLKVNRGQAREGNQVFINASIRRRGNDNFCMKLPVSERHLYTEDNPCAFRWYEDEAFSNIWVELDGPDASKVTWKLAVTSVTPIPEPQSWALMLGGFGAIGWAARRRKPGTHPARA